MCSSDLNEPVQTAMDFDDVYNTYKDKVKRFNNSYHAKAMTQDYLVTVHHQKHIYDFIYVDAHHTSASALLDCELSWPLLKPEGILAIDDYLWEHPDGNPIHAPKLGIHMFLDRHEGEFDLLVMNSQVWLRKK